MNRSTATTPALKNADTDTFTRGEAETYFSEFFPDDSSVTLEAFDGATYWMHFSGEVLLAS